MVRKGGGGIGVTLFGYYTYITCPPQIIEGGGLMSLRIILNATRASIRLRPAPRQSPLPYRLPTYVGRLPRLPTIARPPIA